MATAEIIGPESNWVVVVQQHGWEDVDIFHMPDEDHARRWANPMGGRAYKMVGGVIVDETGETRFLRIQSHIKATTLQ